MSKRDYYLCDCCNEKCFYDADIPDRFEQAGKIKAICKQCAETHTISIDGKAVAANIDRLKNQQALAENVALYAKQVGEALERLTDDFIFRLAEKDREIEYLQECRISAAAMDAQRVIEYQQLMEKAVRFAENITRNGRWQEHEWKDANIFLNSPEVQAWKDQRK